MNLSLAHALRTDTSRCIAFIGAGGKTTAMFQLARSLSGADGTLPVSVTATTHLGAWQVEFADEHIITHTVAAVGDLAHGWKGVMLVTGALEGKRTRPIDDDALSRLYEFCGHHSIPLLIESDGSRQKPLKAPADHEPPLPAFVDLAVQVAGLSGLGKPVDAEHVHRAELFSTIAGLNLGETITPDALIRVLTHEAGGLKNIPPTARRVALLNQADTPEQQAIAKALAPALLKHYHSVVVSSLEQERIFAVHEPVAGIILAAGASTRYGKPKQLLDWKGRPFVHAVTRTAVDAGLSPVIVVTGAYAEQIEDAIQDLQAVIVRNNEWEQGQGSSIKAAMHKIGESVQTMQAGSAIFLLADQPQVTASILWALVEKHAEALYPIVAPMVMDRRANPVLFDRVTFSDLSDLEGDVGGRAVFHKHRVEYLPWHDERILLDVDTPEMYRRLISDETL
jgi:molybdenum cofactor cytidylyltransferase